MIVFNGAFIVTTVLLRRSVESLYLGLPTLVSDIPVHEVLIWAGYCTVIETVGLETADFERTPCGRWYRVEGDDIEKSILERYWHYGVYQVRAVQANR